jgi:hypothetical protein
VSEPTVESLAEELRREVSEAQESGDEYLSRFEFPASQRNASDLESVDGGVHGDPVLALLTDRTQSEDARLELLCRAAGTTTSRGC